LQCVERGFDVILDSGVTAAYINITTLHGQRDGIVRVRVLLVSALTECDEGSSILNCPANIEAKFNSSLVSIAPYIPPTTSTTSSPTTTISPTTTEISQTTPVVSQTTPAPANLCGNGIRTGQEGCDDGNEDDGDGCSATCTVECGYWCTVDEPNECSTACGDSIVAGDEKCDDGNSGDGDGCSADCSVIEDGYSCSSSGSCSASTCLSMTPTPTPAPTPMWSEQVTLVLQLSYTVADFDDAKQQEFKAAIAKAASTTADRVVIRNITAVQGSARRRLLSSHAKIQVDVSIMAESPVAANAMAAQLSSTRINTELQSLNLGSAVIVQDPISTSSMRASSCPPGMYGPDGAPCIPCPPSSYKSLDGRQSPCTPCPPNRDSLPGSTNVSACLCQQDYTEESDGTCMPCPPGSYKNGLGAGQCVYSELVLQETLIADWLLSESRKRPFCIPGSFTHTCSPLMTLHQPPFRQRKSDVGALYHVHAELKVASQPGRGFWARFDRRTW
jgi:cysteine-rich repeat protein